MEGLIIPIGAGVALVFVIWLLLKLTKAIKPMSKEEAIQHEINKSATGSDEEHARLVNRQARHPKGAASASSCLSQSLSLSCTGSSRISRADAQIAEPAFGTDAPAGHGSKANR